MFNEKQLEAINSLEGNIRVVAGAGSGKCLGKDTPILMYDGTIKMVQDIQVGDTLMGADSTPRNVLGITTGREQMYKIIPNRGGNAFTCNASHILSLKVSGNQYHRNGKFRYKKDTVYNIAVKDFLNRGKRLYKTLKLYRTAIDFRCDQSLEIDPYIYGLWLGDGATKTVSLSNPDPEIVQVWCAYGRSLGLKVRENDLERCPTYSLTMGRDGSKGLPNKFLSFIRESTESGHKRILHRYKTASREDRLKLLAGIIDTDGYKYPHVCRWEITSKYKDLAEDYAYLIRSLGYRASIHYKAAKCNDKVFDAWRVFIGGDLRDCPIKLRHKKADREFRDGNPLKTGFKIEDVGIGDYYGFEIDGDGLFVLGDFTVTHNTSVLTHRYAKLIENDVAPEEILCVTFTNKAANEMKERIEKLVGFSNYTQICTFHSFCLRVLKQSISLLGYTNKFVIIDNEDQKAILKKVYKECKINYEEVSYGTALDIISERKVTTEDSLVELLRHSPLIKEKYDANAKDLKECTYKDYNTTLKNTIYYGYLYYQQKSNGLDFNDLIIVTVMLFNKNPKILAKWQDRLRYLMVDEFQDVSQRQFELVKMLSAIHGNLFVVGDPDQTIYSWRGAKPEILVDLDKSLKDVKTIIMNQNYRSTPEILQVANELISKNELRIEKDLFTENPSGDKIFFKHLNNNKEEADFIVENTERALGKHDYKPQDVAILYRAHFLSRVIEEKLIRSKVPYVIHSGTNFYERKEIKDILSYLKVILNPKDDLALERIINVPTRGIGEKKLESIKELAKVQNCSLYEACRIMSKEKGNTKLEDFLIIIDRLKLHSAEYTVYELTQSVLELSGYDELMKKSLEQERVENVEELLRAIKELPTDTTLEDYLQQIAILTNVDKNERKNCVTLMTIHSSKGLEFPVVFVVGMSDGIFPNGKVNSMEQVEEERRLAYVAFTRAKKNLILTDSDGYDYNKKESRKTSRFICEMNADYVIGSQIPDYDFEPLYTPSMYFGDDWGSRKAQWGKGQYFDSDGKYYDWDDDTYLQGSISMEDII